MVNRTLQRPPAPAPGSSSPVDARAPQPLTAVKMWALLGGLVVAFIVYAWGRWILGPNFTPVETGPSHPPTWMNVVQITYQALSVPAVLFCFYWFLWRPWRRDGRMSADGLLCIGLWTLWFQDPLSNYFQPWFLYNTHLVNMGSWVQSFPGWQSYAKPGHMMAEPVLFMMPLYVYAFIMLAIFGCAVMRKTSERFPGMGPIGLVSVCFAVMFVMDVVLEGLIWMPLGFYHYGGAPWIILFPGTYHQFPFHEALLAGLLFTAFAALRYFRDDKGQMMVERGADKISGQGRQTIARILAMVAVAQVIFFVTYNGPAMLVAAAAHEWPKDVQQRSYFTNYVCGDQTDRACPGHGVPITRSTDSAYLTPDGQLRPGTAPLPQPVPFDTTPTSAGK